MDRTAIPAVRLIPLSTYADSRGCLTSIEGESEIPFPIRRLFYVYGVTAGSDRAGHAHPTTEQCLIAISGSLNVKLTSPNAEVSFHLDDPAVGLYIPPMIWVRLYDFTHNAVCFGAASTHYAPETVIRDWNDYLVRAQALEAPPE